VVHLPAGMRPPRAPSPTPSAARRRDRRDAAVQEPPSALPSVASRAAPTPPTPRTPPRPSPPPTLGHLKHTGNILSIHRPSAALTDRLRSYRRKIVTHAEVVRARS